MDDNHQKEYWCWKEQLWHSGLDWKNAGTISAGVDVGSVSSKALIMNDDKIFSYCTIRTGYSSSDSAYQALQKALSGTGMTMDDIQYIVGTGYGRVNIPFAHRVLTEISCHAYGAHYLNPAVRTILDMGGQDSKVIRCNERGKVVNFLMNDKCAAGTGRGIEVIADILNVPIEEVGPRSLTVKKDPKPLSSICVVFAKSEVLGMRWRGWSSNKILAAYHASLADRMSNLIRRVGLEPELAITGGIAKNIGAVQRIENRLNVKAVALSSDPQIVGALGAALFGRDSCLREIKKD
ncbi:MAG: acyl-CoA dehydratase activase [Smithellaceae bacterium]